MRSLLVLLHVAGAGLGLLTGRFVPSDWQSPIFFGAIAITIASAIAAHTYSEPKVRSRAGAVSMFLVNWLLGGPVGLRPGRGPLYFTLALLFTCTYVGGLVLAHNGN